MRRSWLKSEKRRDPTIALAEVYDRNALVWNDDCGDSSTAAFSFVLPANCEGSDCLLVVAGVSGANTSGEYRLWIGLDELAVLSGSATVSNAQIASLDRDATPLPGMASETMGGITAEQPDSLVTLRNLSDGDVVYARVETTSGNLRPVLALLNYRSKPLRMGNTSGTQAAATSECQIDRSVSSYRIRVEGAGANGQRTTGNYRLLIRINSPRVLTGQFQSTEEPAIREPIEVRVGAGLEQNTEVDQAAERFSAVATLRMEWQDARLAFDPEDCQRTFKTHTGAGFTIFAGANEILWPEFSVFNQQGNRWIQNRNVIVYADGRAIYLERFTTDCQAPLFNFIRFPFDEQELYIQTVSAAPDTCFVYTDPEELSSIGSHLGEEEWYVVSSETRNTEQDGHTSYWLVFMVRRHLNYDLFRIFLPILLIMLVSWLIFWMSDYGKRVDVASGNLLVFVAFNFTISGELPRLAYLTFMDSILIWTFAVSVLAVVLNMYLKRLEGEGKSQLAKRIDRPLVWAYPGVCILGALLTSSMLLW